MRGAAKTLGRAADRLPRLDCALPCLVAIPMFATFLTLALLRVRTFQAGFDVGYFRQAAHLISHGDDPYITIRGLPLLADHLYMLFFPVAWLTRFLPDLPTLLALQA